MYLKYIQKSVEMGKGKKQRKKEVSRRRMERARQREEEEWNKTEKITFLAVKIILAFWVFHHEWYDFTLKVD